MVVHDRDANRFADRSRELWSERTFSEVQYEKADSRQCYGTCPFSSLIAFFFTLIGTGICCGCLYTSLQETIKKINYLFEIEYIDSDWMRFISLAMIFILAIMGGFSMILLTVGSLATGATRHQIYTGFRSRLGGRIATGFFSLIVYGLLLVWILTMLTLVVPCIGLYILKYRCIEAFGDTSKDANSSQNSPTVPCFTPGTYGLPVPAQKPDVKLCQQRFMSLCSLIDYTPRYLSALIASFFVVLGLVHFLCSLVANYAHIKDGRKLSTFEDAVRQEFEASKFNRN